MEGEPSPGEDHEDVKEDVKKDENVSEEEGQEKRDQAEKQKQIMLEFEQAVYPEIAKLKEKDKTSITDMLETKKESLVNLYQELNLEKKENLEKLAKILEKYENFDDFATTVEDQSDPDLNDLMKIAGAEIKGTEG